MGSELHCQRLKKGETGERALRRQYGRGNPPCKGRVPAKEKIMKRTWLRTDPRSVEKGDVGRRDVQQIDVEFFERVQDASDIGPAGVELLSQVRLPIGPDIRW